MHRRPRLILAPMVATLLLGATVACSGASVAGDDSGLEPLVGQWRGVLLSRGGELPFHFRVNPEGSDPAAALINAGVERPVVSVRRQGAASYTLTFSNDSDSEIVAKMSPDGTELYGYWRMTNDPAPEGVDYPAVTQMPFSATKNDQRRFQRNDQTLDIAAPEAIAALPDIEGEWETRTIVGDVFDHAAGEEFAVDGEIVAGTVVGPAGFEGIYRNGLLRLSMFDGSRALLVHARATPAGALEGSMWMADVSVAQWTARRADTR